MTKRDATTTTGRRQTRARGRRLFGGYVRVSQVGRREADERLRSPQFQEDLIDRRAGEADVDVRMMPAELDVSGSRKARVVLDELVEAIEAGELDGIIVAKLDRLSRLAAKDRLELVERIEAAGGEILSASEAFDTRTAEGRFMRDLFFSIARLEWERYADNWTVAKANAIANGVSIASRRPFGYRFDEDHRLVVDRSEAAVVVELFELRAAGASWSTLLERFEERTGRRTARQTMSKLVRSRVYLGEVSYGELVNAGAHKAIVDVDLFDAVQRVNGERAGDGADKRHAGAAVSMLGGIAKCHGCRRPMSRHSKASAGRRARYECPSPASHCSARASILADELDAFVWDALLEWAGEAADEPIEVELARESVGDRVEAEHRLAEAERVALAYETDVELELELGREAYAQGRKARAELVDRRRRELEELGEASELETVRTTLAAVALADVLEDEDKRPLVGLVVDELLVRKAPRGLDVAERVDLRLEVAGAIAEPASERQAELVEQAVR
jgi:DNA invertase Pin-like site-specific DNA recombinase